MLRIGLTGGIASGKSTVADQFHELGADIVDTDVIARQLVEPGSAALAAIADRFGPQVLNADGTLDRASLRRMVFGDEARRRELEAILHPLIRQHALARAEASQAAYVIVVVPLLFEAGFDRFVDRTLVVDCPEESQLERLIARDGINRQEAEQILRSQLPRAERLARADDVIDNAGDIQATTARVRELDRTYRSMAQNCSAPSGRAE